MFRPSFKGLNILTNDGIYGKYNRFKHTYPDRNAGQISIFHRKKELFTQVKFLNYRFTDKLLTYDNRRLICKLALRNNIKFHIRNTLLGRSTVFDYVRKCRYGRLYNH